MICVECLCDYNKNDRLGKPGKITHCPECASMYEDVEQYTGNMIYSHKTAPSLQINKDPNITKLLNGQSDGDTTHKSGGIVKEADSFNYKNREE